MATKMRERSSHPPEDIIDGGRLGRVDLERLVAAGRPLWLVGCDLEETDASRLNFDNWTFEHCTATNADFSSANLDGSCWLRTRGGGAQFIGTDLSDALFAACDLNNAKFISTVLTDASFERSRMIGTTIDRAKTMRLAFEKCLLGDARLFDISFAKQKLVGLDFLAAQLSNCDFSDAVFDSACSFVDTEFKKCKFKGADLRRADLGMVTVELAKHIRGATISFEHTGHLAMSLGLDVGETL